MLEKGISKNPETVPSPKNAHQSSRPRDSFKIGITLCLEPELGPPTSQLTRLGNTDIHFLLYPSRLGGLIPYSESIKKPNPATRDPIRDTSDRPLQQHSNPIQEIIKKKDTLNTIKSTEPCPTKPVS